MAWIHHMQSGGYIPGFSRQAFGAGLTKDVRSTQKDILKKATKLGKYQQRRAGLGKWGGILGGMALKGLLGSTMGPVGLMLAQAAGSGIGSMLGSSKLLSGEAPDINKGKSGLIGSDYEKLSGISGGLDKQMQGIATGSVLNSLMGSMMGAAGGELKSAFGKQLAGKGLNIGSKVLTDHAGDIVNQGAQGFSGLTDAAKQMHSGAQGAIEAMPITNFGQPQSQAYGNLFGLSQGNINLPNWLAEGKQTGGEAGLGAYQNMFFDSPVKSGLQESLRFKPEDWMSDEDVGGVQNNRVGSLMRAFKDADLNREDIAREYRPRAKQRMSLEEGMRGKALDELGGFGHAEDARRMENMYQQSLPYSDTLVDRRNIGSIQDTIGDLKWGLAGEIGDDKRRLATMRARGEGPLEPLRGLGGEELGDLTTEDVPFEYMIDLKRGRNVLDKDLAYLEKLMPNRDTTRMSGLEREWYDTLPQEEQWGDPRKARLESLMKKYGGMQEGGEVDYRSQLEGLGDKYKRLQSEGVYTKGGDWSLASILKDTGFPLEGTQVDTVMGGHRPGGMLMLEMSNPDIGKQRWTRYGGSPKIGVDMESERQSLMQSWTDADREKGLRLGDSPAFRYATGKSKEESEAREDEERAMMNKMMLDKGYSQEEIDMFNKFKSRYQMGGAVSNPIPYNLGGSVYQQPMQYQLGGLLKYRSPM